MDLPKRAFIRPILFGQERLSSYLAPVTLYRPELPHADRQSGRFGHLLRGDCENEMRLYLIRHAQSQNNALPESQRVEDPGITGLGHEQATLLAKRVDELGLTKLFTSPFRRTLQTTAPIYEATTLTPNVRVALHEQGGCYIGHTAENMAGRSGMSRLEIEQEFPGYAVSADVDDRGWWTSDLHESQELARRRATALFQQTLEEFSGTQERVAFVMHADIALLFLQQFHSEWLDVPANTSITAIRITSGDCRLEEFDCVRHLPEELITR
jgi:2,3-bisphosphoglycerate-dependent phosphoglycerate mutase